MATNPAEIDAGSESNSQPGKKRSYNSIMEDFLRGSPTIITKRQVVKALQGSGPGFMTDHDMANRITVAQQNEYLSNQLDKEGTMKNQLAGKAARGKKARKGVIRKVRAMAGNGGEPEVHETFSPESPGMNKAMKLMEDAEILASKALVSSDVSLDELAHLVIIQAAAFHAVMGDNK
jgi:hypothetical protein